MMLQGRSGSGDGGELIDRVSLTSSISFIQSQTFPESIFSQSYSRYCNIQCCCALDVLSSGDCGHYTVHGKFFHQECSLCTSSRGLGSGMDSRSESDGHEEDEDNTLPLLHAAGDGSNGSAGRPGLEGANSDAEDIPSVGRLPLDASSGLEAQGLGEFLLVEVCALAHSFVYMAYYCIKKLVFLYLITKTG